jgi:hypothetical protein
MKLLYIGTPTYDGRAHASYIVSLVASVQALHSIGWEAQIDIISGGALLLESRNTILANALACNADAALLIDSDIAWDAQSLIRMIQYNLPVVAGVYTSKYNSNDWLFRPKSCAEYTNTGLLVVDAIPAGFVLLSRQCIQALHDSNPHYKYSNDPAEPIKAAIFDTATKNYRFYGEDFRFSEKIKILGYDIAVDTEVCIDHAGVVSCLKKSIAGL